MLSCKFLQTVTCSFHLLAWPQVTCYWYVARAHFQHVFLLSLIWSVGQLSFVTVSLYVYCSYIQWWVYKWFVCFCMMYTVTECIMLMSILYYEVVTSCCFLCNSCDCKTANSVRSVATTPQLLLLHLKRSVCCHQLSLI